MDAALGLVAPSPAAGTGVFAIGGPARAGHAAHRKKASGHQRVRREVSLPIDRLDRLARYVGKWIEFQPGAILFNDWNRRTQARLIPLASIDPGRKRLQRSLQRLHFSN